jgi:hypothetical protein
MAMQDAFSREGALLEHVLRGAVIGVAEGIQSRYPQLNSQIDH